MTNFLTPFNITSAAAGGACAFTTCLYFGAAPIAIPATGTAVLSCYVFGYISSYWMQTTEQELANRSKEIEVGMNRQQNQSEKLRFLADYSIQEFRICDETQARIRKQKQELIDKELKNDKQNDEQLSREIKDLKDKIEEDQYLLMKRQISTAALAETIRQIGDNEEKLHQYPFSMWNIITGGLTFVLELSFILIVIILVKNKIGFRKNRKGK